MPVVKVGFSSISGRRKVGFTEICSRQPDRQGIIVRQARATGVTELYLLPSFTLETLRERMLSWRAKSTANTSARPSDYASDAE